MNEASVLVSRDDAVMTVTLNRPDRLNAMTAEMLDRTVEVFTDAAHDDSVRVLILTGAGRGFCAGGDLSQGPGGGVASAFPPPERARALRAFMETSRLLHTMPAVTIAAINGACAGAGLSWACATDLRYSADTARFNAAFLNAGLSGDFGGTWFLPRIIGYGRAREKYLESQPFDAAEALRIGLVSRLFAREELMDGVGEIARRLAEAAPLALARIKQNFIDSATATLEDALDYESVRHTFCAESADASEAADAFIGKRTPAYAGR
ncbi:enoyl-CoA hydratase-related protein [Microbacterium sp. ASV49]|uniref:Enoyl-CoA hydratase-related protein n=1 Tax=Microbacterium candidum TaxID=3041922 RepID=A0ABT7MV87_9MICO|nr:enoyl-CoA hydratase-related protein [Microbacterium sp. ASV49]MDL9978365.1 enoyl-CoA hydratase-related protein [Microbacterium sp. ASV49]